MLSTFIDLSRDQFDIITNIVHSEEVLDFSTLKYNTVINNSVGGCYGFNKKKFIEAGMENEEYERFGYEDRERHERFKILGYKIYRSSNPLYHLSHFRGKDSQIINPHTPINRSRLRKISGMSKEELLVYISKWEWVK